MPYRMMLQKVILVYCVIIFFSSQILATFNQYIEGLDGTSEYFMSNHTKRRLKTSYKNDKIQLYGAALDAKHASFNASKAQLIQDWEQYTGLAWPKYAYPTNNRNRGDRFDAHHIIPQSYNGTNQWWNLFPLSNAQHHQIHSNASVCSQLFPNSRGAGRVNEQYLQ